MEVGDPPRDGVTAIGSGRVHRTRLCRRRSRLPLGGEQGFTLVEVVMTMVLLSVGIMGLAPVMLAVFQGNRWAQDMSLATALAEDRLERILHHPRYDQITEANFPDEAQGTIRAGDPRYRKFARSVTIVDSMNVLGQSLLKSVTVTVTWTGIRGQNHNVTLFGRQSRF
ncbi:MAG: prepilin-type N-terminal cleavage/methylation domain-containing protein [bacterium]